jgi:hypothetical protein
MPALEKRKTYPEEINQHYGDKQKIPKESMKICGCLTARDASLWMMGL